MIESLVREQYGRSVDILERGELTEGVIIPPEAECIDILRDTLTDKQITYVQEKMRRAVFQIVPQRPFWDFENAMNLNLREGEPNTYLDTYVRVRFLKMPSGKEVQIGFVEGSEILPATPLIRFQLSKQEELYKNCLPEGVNVIHPRNYALLQSDLRIDVDHFSVLEDNSKDRTRLLGASCGYSQLRFGGYDPGNGGLFARWRSQIMKVVQ